MKISVIIPVYNAEKFLHRCVESVLSQSFQDFELILVNDGSNDTSGVLCDNFKLKDSRIRVFHQENKGVSAARNKGIDNAQGEFFCFIDSDDWIDNTYLSDFFHLKSIDVDMYIQGYVNDYEESNKSKKVGFNESKHYSHKDLGDVFKYAEINNINNSPCWKLFKSDIIRDNNIYYDESISYGEDHLFVLKYFEYVNSVFTSCKNGYHYVHQSSDSLTTSYVSDYKLYYYGSEVYKARKNALSLFRIKNYSFQSFIEKQFGIYILLSVASMYDPKCLMNRKERIEKIDVYKNYLKNMRLNESIYRDNYFYCILKMLVTSNIIYKDLSLKTFINLRRTLVKFK